MANNNRMNKIGKDNYRKHYTREYTRVYSKSGLQKERDALLIRLEEIDGILEEMEVNDGNSR